MTIERVNSRPTRWTTLLGLVLVPLLVAGGMLWASWNSSDRLRTVQAAIVNLDEAVTIDDQYIPLGRQLTAALVDSDREQNLDWVMASEDDARAGIASGRYAAMVIIPEEFSRAATSYSGDAEDAERATIIVQTSPVAGVADATLGKVVANAAAQTLNETLTSTYLDQIYIGFNDMGKQFVSLADGSDELADGAEKLADGIGQASDGANQLSGGASDLANGLGQMAEQTSSMPADVRKLANGTKKYVAGVGDLVDSTISSLGQQAQLVSGVAGLAGGLQQAHDGFANGADSASQGAAGIEQLAGAVQAGAPGYTAEMLAGAINQACPSVNATADNALDKAPLCEMFLKGMSAGLDSAADGLTTTDASGQSLLSGLKELSEQLTKASEAAGDPAKAKKQLKKLKSGGNDLADGTSQLADGIGDLVDGIDQVADGSRQLADGVDSLASGLGDAADGSSKLARGARKMADGIADGKDQIPHYTKTDRKNLSEVVSQPVATEDLQGTSAVGAGWLSLMLVLATWLGALATFLVLKALGSRILTSSKSTAALVAESLLPGFAVVGVQALVLTGIGQIALDLPAGKLAAVAGLMVLAGAAFVVINHALVAWWGGIGRLISIGFVVLSAATALTSATPPIFETLRMFSPITPALDAIRAVLTESDGVATNTIVLVGWLLLGLGASAVAVLRARTTTLAALVASHGVPA